MAVLFIIPDFPNPNINYSFFYLIPSLFIIQRQPPKLKVGNVKETCDKAEICKDYRSFPLQIENYIHRTVVEWRESPFVYR